MRNLMWKILIILTAIVISTMAIVPPKEKLKLGKDLAGGTTITWGIKPNANGQMPTQAEIAQMIDIIRDRLDPRGVYDISIEVQGGNQIQISMPAPQPEVIEAKNALDKLLDELSASTLKSYDVDNAITMPAGEARTQRFEELSSDVPGRMDLFKAAADLHDSMLANEAAYRKAESGKDAAIRLLDDKLDQARKAADEATKEALDVKIADTTLSKINAAADDTARQTLIKDAIDQSSDKDKAEAVITRYLEAEAGVKSATDEISKTRLEWEKTLAPLAQQAIEASNTYDKKRAELLKTSINVDELRRILTLDKAPKYIRDTTTNKMVPGPSLRDQSLSQLEEQYPLLKSRIDDIVSHYDEYKGKSRGYDDPKDLIALLRGAGILSFHIAVSPTDSTVPISDLRKELRDRGPGKSQISNSVRWFRIDKPEQWGNDEKQLDYMQKDPVTYFAGQGLVAEKFDGIIYVLLYTSPDKTIGENSESWKLTGAYKGIDQKGRPNVNFRLDPTGGRLMGKLTSSNIDKPMAIVLDGRVYSAPNINSTINDSGEIEGRFSSKDIDYLLRVLNSGSLSAQLTDEPIAQNSIGPQLGLDNLQRGYRSGIISFIAVSAFMAAYYFFYGAVADVALACTALFILGAMALINSAFTMPGIAGIVLTFGMAVDANVLIYERIREEILNGCDLKTALNLGYERAMSSIIDGNVTNLIACFVLGFTASADVKGFAITLGIGVGATLFSALYITRVIFFICTEYLGVKRLSMLPLVIPAIDRILNPSIDWVGIRKFWYFTSGSAVIISIILLSMTWREMLDTEFMGGTSVTISLKDDPATHHPMLMPRAEVAKRLADYAIAQNKEGKLSSIDEKSLIDANVLNLNIDKTSGADFRSSSFVIKSTISDQQTVERAVTTAFADVLDIPKIITFTGSDLKNIAAGAPAYPILDPVLGNNVNDPNIRQDVRSFFGGTAIVLDHLNPPVSVAEVQKRLDQAKRSPEFEKYLGRSTQVIGITIARPDNGANSGTGSAAADSQADNSSSGPLFSKIVVVAGLSANDPSAIDDLDQWKTTTGDSEWQIVRSGLTEPPTLDELTTISPTVARQLRQTAVVSIIFTLAGILIYIGVRFNSLRYASAAVIALIHDVTVAMGCLALTHYVYNTEIGKALLLEPFKIDMGVIAALLTILGYSLNDTIINLDRIRENRGKLPLATREVINTSINSCISRTVFTSGTTLLATIIMYFEGGTGIRAFAFCMLIGIVTGTYSSVGVAAPMVLQKHPKE